MAMQLIFGHDSQTAQKMFRCMSIGHHVRPLEPGGTGRWDRVIIDAC